MTRSVIDPITRIEGHLRVEMEVENGVVADAWVSGGCFRGMELVVQNRTPEDAAQIVERICGVCPVSHAHASSIAGDKAYGITTVSYTHLGQRPGLRYLGMVGRARIVAKRRWQRSRGGSGGGAR